MLGSYLLALDLVLVLTGDVSVGQLDLDELAQRVGHAGVCLERHEDVLVDVLAGSTLQLRRREVVPVPLVGVVSEDPEEPDRRN